MKLIKKLSTVLFVFMMVLATTTMVFAADTGTITVDGAIDGQSYSIYQILKLDSYDADGGRYAYKPANGQWKDFIKTGAGKDYFSIDDAEDLVTWKEGVVKDKVAELAAKALAYAKEKNITATATQEKQKDVALTFSVNSLGYYLVDSNVGVICSLDTTKPDASIKEKNDVPELKNEAQENLDNSWKTDFATAKIGDNVKFKTTITAKPGAENYELTVKMSDGFTFKDDIQIGYEVTPGAGLTYLTKDTDYTVDKTDAAATFKIKFTDTYLENLRNELGIKDAGNPKTRDLVVDYSAMLNEKANSNADINTNIASLKFGDNQTTTSQTVKVKTYKLPVHKYFKDPADNNTEKALAGAVFTLSNNEAGTNPINLVSVNVGAATVAYRVAKETEDPGVAKVAEITTPDNGKFEILGLDTGTYYLTETKAPNGYNKLSKPVKITVKDNTKITVGDDNTELIEVKVENKTGTLLPSTGGVGTKAFYVVGAALVIGSIVVLITKKNAK